jgi:hypothetical protein
LSIAGLLRNPHLDRHHIAGIQSQIDVDDASKTGEEETGSDEQHDSERYLGDDECRANRLRVGPGCTQPLARCEGGRRRGYTCLCLNRGKYTARSARGSRENSTMLGEPTSESCEPTFTKPRRLEDASPKYSFSSGSGLSPR